ncbi:sensor histidine kinase [Chthonobacter rhizosphaerae]|uniref:sensor histidine kinase n=1 Tax=Chthonobacter rhizosphaerae TaxID=2735553 RepID=UPI0015EF2E13|nr:PAS domain S-box protein [Chthonobacter rhizosphaerae]
MTEADDDRRLLALDEAFHAAPSGMAIIDRDGRYLQVNQALARMNGLSIDAHMGLRARDVVPEIAAVMESVFAEVLRTGEAVADVEVSGPRPGATAIRHYLESVTPLRDARGAVTRLLVSVQDVTRIREAETGLRQALAKSAADAAEREAILGQLEEGVVVADPAGLIVYMNEAAVRIHGTGTLGTPPERYVSEYGLLREDGTVADLSDLPLYRALRYGEAVVDARWRIRRPNGAEVMAIGSARPVTAPDGRPMGAVLTLRDDTARHRAELALAESERRLTAVLDNTTMAIFLMDERQHCAYMNAAAETLTGFTFADTLGRHLHDVVHHTYPDGRHFPIEDCAIDRAFPENMQTQGEEVFVHRDGSFYPVAFTASPIRDETSRTIGTVVEVRGIREEKEAQARMEMLVAELNHRVKNTLATAQAIVWQGLKDSTVPPRVRERIESRLGALARSHDILTKEAWLGADMDEVVDAALAPFGLHQTPGRFSIGGPMTRLAPRAALMIGMALHELATNAAKYGALKEGGHVRLTWRRDGQRLEIEWRESGGPAITPPASRGFGTRVLERAAAHELDAEVSLDFPPTGVVWRAAFPLALPAETT